MYLGRLVEEGPAEALLRAPLHPYTRMLLEAVPVPDPSRRRLPEPSGDPASLAELPPGCAFYARCPAREDRCAHRAPAMTEVPGGRRVACWRVAGDGVDVGHAGYGASPRG
jgi:oligopeptide/dipeptide ABC transporter ATP-binding protein